MTVRRGAITVEKAAELLEKNDPAMPDDFEAKAVAWSPSLGGYVVKWNDPAEKEIYDEIVADPDTAVPEKAADFTPTWHYSAILFSRAPDGEDDLVATRFLTKSDVLALKNDRLENVDVKP